MRVAPLRYPQATTIPEIRSPVPHFTGATVFARQLPSSRYAKLRAAVRCRLDVKPYLFAIFAGTATIMLRASLEPILENDHIFVIPLLGVVLVSWKGGFWPGSLCLVGTTVAAVYLFMEPQYSFAVARRSDQLAIGLYFFAGLGCALLGESQLSSLRRAAMHLAISQAKQMELEILAEQLKVAQTETTDTLNALFESERELLRSHEDLEENVAIRTQELFKEVITRRKAEQHLEAITNELRRSNSELEQFAYVASHDLQEPLRKIQAFGDRLRIRCADKLDETSGDYLQRMLTSAGRMRQLINDLLELSRVTSNAQPFSAVDLDQILGGVLSDFELRIAQTEAIVEVDKLGSIQADPLQMRQLFHNLLGNALKFKKPGTTPRVGIRAEELPGEFPRIRFSVSDNGIGFEEKYLDRIFQVFQRLHSRDEYEGTGVGLAICNKIVLRHGGHFTAQSLPGQGATFLATLPMAQPRGEGIT